MRSGDTASDRAQRATEVTNLRANADALGQGTQIIFAGDFNMQSSSEGAWTNMLAPGNAQAFDTADSPGDWRDNVAFISLHSHDSGGEMDDRFDFQFVSGELMDGVGLEYIPGSYHVFGNNGTHKFNDRIGTGSGASQAVLAALENASDHLPVVADFKSAVPLAAETVTIVNNTMAVQKWAKVTYDPPASMRLKEFKTIELSLLPFVSWEDLESQIREDIPETTEEVRVIPDVEAKLTGRGCTIVQTGKEKQAILKDEPIRWKWDVTFTEVGQQRLYLSLSTTILFSDTLSSREIGKYENEIEVIEVEVTWQQRVSIFWSHNWQWLISTILIPAATGTAVYLKMRMKKGKKTKTKRKR